MAELIVDNIQCSHDGAVIVSDISFRIPSGKGACLLGPSGCGKTTVLRAIAGFQAIDSGRISLGSECIADAEQSISPEKRGVGMVFQDYALFPHLSVIENVAFGLAHLDKQEREQRAYTMLDVVGMRDKAKVYPRQLSGGQQQRVALARALAPSPKFLLLDEPFSNLDSELRARLSHEVKQILEAQSISFLLVTHDQSEAFAMTDEIGFLHEGKLLQWADAQTLYHRPNSLTVANFIGEGTTLYATENAMLCEKIIQHSKRDTDKTAQNILIRPDAFLINETGEFCAQVLSQAFQGTMSRYQLLLDDKTILSAYLSPMHALKVDEKIHFNLDPAKLLFFPAT